ncbi:MAG TPA: histidinol dehydrogenase [Firmicutes bacterium]|nr:histidinol dehydrogenase [Bacillota bacterium]
MIKIFDKDFDINKILSREIQSYGEYEESVRQIVADVMTGGDAAVKKYTRKFDGVSVDGLAVSGDEIDEAFASVSPRFLEVVEKSAENIAEFHSKQIKSGFEINRDGVTLGQKYTAVEKAGLYVPGGTASYPSTVLMNAVPAKIAGVGEIIMCTPPSANGKVRAEILAAAKIAGVDRIYKCGGAQAIAAMAYGTESIPKVYKIVGPGNIFVALAKKLVFGTVSIDMIAGPSEILVVADGKADARHVAADMLSQAEHDKLASAVLVTDSAALAKDVAAEIDRQLETLPRREIASASIENNGKIIVTDSIERAVEVANAIAPEHLEMCVENPRAWLDKIKNAGSVFLGGYTPEALGDYYAGPNHTLPTGGSAKFSSPLSVDDFVKKTQYIMYSAEALEKAAADVEYFAESEGLDGHARSVKIRFGGAK